MCGQYRTPRGWENEFLWVTGCKGTSFCSITKRITWGASIYHLWRQRNVRIHDKVFVSVESILSLICNDVRLRISSLQKVDDKPINRAMC